MRLAQLLAMIRYEVKMQWRRRGLPMLMVAFILGLLLLSLWFRGIRREGQASFDEGQVSATLAMVYGWPVTLLLLILAVPPMLADTAARDRQVGVRELLDSLPLSPALYLTGKLLGAWASLLAALAGVAVLHALMGWLIQGPYDLGVYAVWWAIGAVPLALYTAGMSVLLAAGQPTRRRAALVGMAFAAYCLVMAVTTSGTVRDAVSLARPSVFLVMFLGLLAEIGLTSYPPFQIPLTLGLGALQVVLAWLIVWVWTQWKAGR